MADEETQPNATVYVRNLDEKVKIPALISALRTTFSEFGTILDIVAKKSLKRKGQAFVIYDSADSAQEAVDELQGFELFGQQIEVDFAKTKSDIIVQRDEGDGALEEHKKHRVAEKERKQALEAAQAKPAKRAQEDNLAERPAKTAKSTAPNAAVPDEYLPPNKILFLRDLPESYTKEQLALVFGRYPGFKEVRLVPGRAMGFAEYEEEAGAIAAKERLAGKELDGKAIKVTFQRQ